MIKWLNTRFDNNSKTETLKACAVGISHVALEVGDIDEALAEPRAKNMTPE
ncbi:hypothetical protein [Nitrosomonas mobilis]|uniref:Uncharacterized protein n=1 Tax=Nitrosomonas mobilis TaxID=51642 RepID=A0A1G5SCC1_9PROT|nr:hypothetical protein [Nitrosomonas mobilis]SCZ84460.1 hypothetical protein NSMM_180007 [Nitrosomonas mobilis]